MKRSEQIVFEGKTKKGITYTVRYPKLSDADALRKYINQVSRERTFISFQGEQLTLKEEKQFLKDSLRKIKNREAVVLLIDIEGKTIGGVCGLTMRARTFEHVGELGLSVSKSFRGQGLGKLLIQSVIAEARKRISKLRIIMLRCYANNTVALSLYRRVGFKKYGTLPKGIRYKGRYIDEIEMYLNLK